MVNSLLYVYALTYLSASAKLTVKVLSLPANESPLIPAFVSVGVCKAPLPVAADGVPLPSKDNAFFFNSAVCFLDCGIMLTIV